MEPALLADVLHGQRQARLVAGDGLMLGAVVLKHAVQFLHAGTQEHI